VPGGVMIDRVLAAYSADCQPQGIESLGSAGGFSGARFWRIAAGRGCLCLRRWPRSHPTSQRLDWIHAVLRHAERYGFDLLPVPFETRRGRSHVRGAGALWELAPWLPGTADSLCPPHREKLSAALIALAEFHRAVSSFPARDARRAVSPGIVLRQQRLDRLANGGAARLAAAIRPEVWPEMEQRAWQLLEHFDRLAPSVARQLQVAAGLVVELKPCLRDIWSDHVLFVSTRVSGIIDFGAMRYETVAAAVGRLLGSMAGSDREAWFTGLAAFESVYSLSREERTLVAAFDQSGLLMSGLNWIEWIYCDQRRFDNRQAIVARVDRLTARLAHASPTDST